LAVPGFFRSDTVASSWFRTRRAEVLSSKSIALIDGSRAARAVVTAFAKVATFTDSAVFPTRTGATAAHPTQNTLHHPERAYIYCWLITGCGGQGAEENSLCTGLDHHIRRPYDLKKLTEFS
jgi:hypothetical protein